MLTKEQGLENLGTEFVTLRLEAETKYAKAQKALSQLDEVRSAAAAEQDDRVAAAYDEFKAKRAEIYQEIDNSPAVAELILAADSANQEWAECVSSGDAVTNYEGGIVHCALTGLMVCEGDETIEDDDGRVVIVAALGIDPATFGRQSDTDDADDETGEAETVEASDGQ